MEGLEEIKIIIKSLIISEQSGCGISLMQLDNDYKEFTGNILPYQKLGYKSLLQFLEALNDTVLLIRTNNDVKVHSAFSKNSNHITKMIKAQKPPSSSGRKRSSRNYNIRRTVFPESLPTTRQNNILMERQYNHYGSKIIPVNKSNQNNSNLPPSNKSNQMNNILSHNQHIKTSLISRNDNTEFLKNISTKCTESHEKKHEEIKCNNYVKVQSISEIPEEKYYSRKNRLEYLKDTSLGASYKKMEINTLKKTGKEIEINFTPEKKNFNESNLNNLNKSLTENNKMAIPKLNYIEELFMMDYDFLDSEFGLSIPKAQFPDEIKINKMIKLFISEIYSPFKFWFNIATNSLENPLDKLMTEIGEYYTNLQSNELKIVKSIIEPGQPCAVFYQNLWHRAEILDTITSSDEVIVFFVDYGTVSKCKLNNLKYLLFKFAELPRQAYRGTLSDIQPINGKWDEKAINFFVKHVIDVLLYGGIVCLEENHKICHFRLMKYCSADKHKIFINDLLVTENYAEPFSKSENKINSEKKIYYNQQVFPSFEVLEMGKYPKFKKILNILDAGNLNTEDENFLSIQLEKLNFPSTK